MYITTPEGCLADVANEFQRVALVRPEFPLFL